MAVIPLCRPTTRFTLCISVHEPLSQHSSHFVFLIGITLKCGFSILLPIIIIFWDWFSSYYAFEQLESLLHRATVRLERKDPLSQSAAFLPPPCCSPEWLLFYLSFPSGNTATTYSVKMLYSLSNLTSWEQVPNFRWYFLCYKFIHFFQISISNAWYFFLNIAKVVYICLALLYSSFNWVLLND